MQLDDGGPEPFRPKVRARDRVGRWVRQLLGALLALILTLLVIAAGVYAYQAWPVGLPPRPERFQLIAHRGVHHDFSAENLTSTTCTATRIFPPTHRYIENTLPSMAAGFRSGATWVEIDLQPTSDGRLVVFHDHTLDCRTNGTGVTSEQPLAELKQLDVGYGYTADGGKTFPLRGKGVRAMPSFKEVLRAFPTQRFMLDVKNPSPEMQRLLARTLGQLPPERQRTLTLWTTPEVAATVRRSAPQVRRLLADRSGELKECAVDYALRLGFGSLPASCRGASIALPTWILDAMPGWPNRFLSQAHAAGVPVYVETDDPAEAVEAAKLPISGIMTDRVEVVGPALAKAGKVTLPKREGAAGA